jgi:hypothetical protein
MIVMTEPDARVALIRDWLGAELGWPVRRLETASADASFRRYFRAWGTDGATRVVMDAPPEHENIESYLRVSNLLAACGVHVPHVDAADAGRGLVLLEDLGSTPYLAQLQSSAAVASLYDDALSALLRIQVEGHAAAPQLPPYDRAALEREMRLMPDWFCVRHLRLELDAQEYALLEEIFEFLVREALAQPRVFVHRDYHSRNLMVTAERNPGVIDFQDAVHGPIGYDLVSLLKDCYISWPRPQVERWVSAYHARLRAAGMHTGASEALFLRWFDLIGVQRHIKVLGIFARLWYRDGKIGYLQDLPRTLNYVHETAARYPELMPFGQWLERRILAQLPPANERELGLQRA